MVNRTDDKMVAANCLADDCARDGCSAARGFVIDVEPRPVERVFPLPPLKREAPSKYQPCGMSPSLPVPDGISAKFTVPPTGQRLDDLITIDDLARPLQPYRIDVGALQTRIRSLQDENERLAALADYYLAKLTKASQMMLRQPVVVSRAAVVRWVALSSGWHHWPCVTTGAKVPEREPHPLHRAIAVRKEGFPR